MARAEKERIAERLRAILIAARAEADITQKALAARMGRPQSFVSNYERGAGRVDVADLILISKALELDPADVLKGWIEVRFCLRVPVSGRGKLGTYTLVSPFRAMSDFRIDTQRFAKTGEDHDPERKIGA